MTARDDLIKNYIEKLIKELELGECILNNSIDIFNKIKDKSELTGYKPSNIAGGIVYIASVLCEDIRSLRDISNVVNVHENSISLCYHKLLSILKLKPIITKSNRVGAITNEN